MHFSPMSPKCYRWTNNPSILPYYVKVGVEFVQALNKASSRAVFIQLGIRLLSIRDDRKEKLYYTTVSLITFRNPLFVALLIN
ncbi:hypothetical protein J2W97_002840 [Paenibacillus jamilae]|nr:hypothetical protein [Paenibacillus jamilae]